MESSSPHLNHLIHVVRLEQEGRAGSGQFRRAVEDMVARLEIARRDHETLSQSEGVPEEISDLSGRTMAVFGDFQDGLQALLAGDHDGGVERCKQAASVLGELQVRFDEVQRRESTAKCLMCSHPNLPKARSCARCGAVLPEQMERSAATREGGPSDMVMIPPEYVELYNACDAVAAGRMPVEEWHRIVEAMWQAFSQTRTFVGLHLSRHAADLEAAAELRPVEDALVVGLGVAEEGLREMQFFQEDGSAEHLNQGWVALLKGTRKIQESSVIFLAQLQALHAAAQGKEPGPGGAEEGKAWKPGRRRPEDAPWGGLPGQP